MVTVALAESCTATCTPPEALMTFPAVVLAGAFAKANLVGWSTVQT